ncbi:MAG TPA: aminopeptidase P family N-terminal domain-containing protein [Micropepsaceae bacterium]|nr:aminopeptidase P family N-terminal domain-containing protein [Micropepsaceae bacterium]
MRRGLMAWDPEEIPIDTLRQRIGRLQSAMGAAGQDAILLYTNFVRSGAVSYLTAFSPYWADGVLLVPREGEPVFATTLSKRVGSWIQSVKPIGGLVTSPTPGTVLGQKLAAGGGIRRLAILELDNFPSGLYGEIEAALPGTEIVDGSETFAAARRHLDDVERRLLAKAQSIAQGALDRLPFDITTDVGSAVGAVEEYARLQGAEEVYVAIAADLDSDRRFVRLSGNRPLGRRFAIRATVAYKGAWVRQTKTFSKDDKDRLPIARADARFRTFAASIDEKFSLRDQVAAGFADLAGTQLVGWMAEAAVGTHPLAVVASSEKPTETRKHVAGLIVTLGLTIDGVPWCGAGLAGLAQGNSSP